MLLIGQKPLDEMTGDAAQAYPDECCGFFFGRENDNERIITKTLAVHNSKEGDKRRRFEISARDYLKAEKFAAENELQLLGVYHSHPDHPALPSEHDRVAAQPYFSYIIISVKKNKAADIRSWRLNENFQFEEEENKNHLFINQIK